MKKWFLLIIFFMLFVMPETSFGYKITTVAPSYYNSGYYGGYRYLPTPPPPPQTIPNVPYNNSTYYNYYNRVYPPVTPLISQSYRGTRVVMPYGYSNYFTPSSVRNYGTTTVKQYYTPTTNSTNSRVLRYYY